jgi:3-phenylpropionate/trans-cinnamate dioxygenase ferredoxin reductase component
MVPAAGHVVVVGASLAGVRAAEALRREGFTGRLTLIGAERHFPPYDRPPLSKELLLGAWQPERARLRVSADLDAELALGQRATGLDLDRRQVTTSGGGAVGFDGLVIATGAAPRWPSLPGTDLAGVLALRTVEDSLVLQRELAAGPRVVVVGAGFIGCEVASACRQQGLDVTVVEVLPLPLIRVLGPDMGEIVRAYHDKRGVLFRLGAKVAGLRGSGRVRQVDLTDGTSLQADLVVLAIGAVPETRWLDGCGLVLDDGVVCDQTCAAVGAYDVVAAGDVARWFNPLFGETMRVEHWSNAAEQAEAAAATLLAGRHAAEPYQAVPYFWSDQHGKKLQFVGIPAGSAHVVEGSVADERFVAAYERSGRVVGALVFSWPARMARYRRLIAARTDFATVS